MRLTLTFNYPEEKEEAELAIHASDYQLCLWETAQRVFRPARKHGYNNPKINILASTDEGQKLIALLEEEFYSILKENGVEL